MAPTNFTLLPFLFFLLSTFPSISSPTNTTIQYTKHCSSTVSEPTLTTALQTSSVPLHISNHHFTGATNLFNPPHHFNTRLYSFYAHKFFETTTPHVLKLEAQLLIHGDPTPPAQSYIQYSNDIIQHNSLLLYLSGVILFELSGFWSVRDGVICMVGQSTASVPLSVVLKARCENSSNIFNSLATGTIESSDGLQSPNYFDSISFMGLVDRNYKYTMISKATETCSRLKLDEESVNAELDSFCSFFESYPSGMSFRLNYRNDCDGLNCTPPSTKFMFLNLINCVDDQNLRLHIRFHSNRDIYEYPLEADKSLIGEGYWDHNKNRLCALACHIRRDNSSQTVTVGDCNIGLSLQFPSQLSIKSRSAIVGRMWNTKQGDKGQMNTISFSMLHTNVYSYPPNLKYKYTVLDNAKKSCKMDNTDTNSKNLSYPSSVKEMSVPLALRDPNGNAVYGNAELVSIGETCYNINAFKVAQNDLSSKDMGHIWNVSYQISYRTNRSEISEISAEGIYDVRTRKLCMIGCQHVENSDSMDCDIRIDLQFNPPRKGTSENTINGTIRSTRDKTDKLYFEYGVKPFPFFNRVFASAMHRQFGKPLNMKVDTSIVLVLSLAISCLCFLSNLLHVKKHLMSVPSMSVTWFVIFNLSAIVSLMSNFEHLFSVKNNTEDFWLATTGAIVGVLIATVLLSQFCLLFTIWFARPTSNRIERRATTTKEKIIFHSVLYFSGRVVSLLVQSSIQTQRLQNLSSITDFWDDVISYACLVLDGFLLPQLILNTFWNPREVGFAPIFYLGTTILQALPHFSNTYMDYQYVNKLRVFYNFIIPGQALVLALVLFLLRESESSIYRKNFRYKMAQMHS